MRDLARWKEKDLRNRLEQAINKLRRKGIFLEGLSRELYPAISVLAKVLEDREKVEIPGHDIEHSFRVLEFALFIASKEGGNPLVLALAALFHDIFRAEEELKSDIDHEIMAAELVSRELSGLYSSEILENVVKCIKEHRYSKFAKPSTKESQIFQDADKLDALGAIGIARVFAYSGYKNRYLYDPLNLNAQDSIAHFREKILKLPYLMNTKAGMEIAYRRVSIIRKFLKELVREIEF